MTTWPTVYEPVSKPTESKKGWKFPYNGDNWPTKEDWYWVWACKPDHSPDSVFMVPSVSWWDEKQQRFLALGNKVVYAWHKAVRHKEVRNEQI